MASDFKLMQFYDELIIKRNQQTMLNSTYDKYKHMCVIIDSKSGEPLSYGYNIFKPNSCKTEHAEAMALRKLLRKVDGSRRRICIDIFVVRTNGSNSKPCYHCLQNMYKHLYKFNIKMIYYSHEAEPTGIRREKFMTMYDSDDHHISSYYRHNKARHNVSRVLATDDTSSDSDS